MITELEKALGAKGKQRGKYVHFYRCNVASKEDVERVWKEVIE